MRKSTVSNRDETDQRRGYTLDDTQGRIRIQARGTIVTRGRQALVNVDVTAAPQLLRAQRLVRNGHGLRYHAGTKKRRERLIEHRAGARRPSHPRQGHLGSGLLAPQAGFVAPQASPQIPPRSWRCSPRYGLVSWPFLGPLKMRYAKVFLFSKIQIFSQLNFFAWVSRFFFE